MKLYHDSRSLDCRAPFGAVRCGDIVRLRVYCQGRPRAVNAVITLNNQPYTIPLQPDGRDGYASDDDTRKGYPQKFQSRDE